MTEEEILAGLLQELKRGTIVLSVLSQLNTPMYGYNLVTRLSENGMSVETNTLYPLLRRLESQGLLKSEWDVSGGKPRKYYIITETGSSIYKKLRCQWLKNAESMEKLLSGSTDPEASVTE